MTFERRSSRELDEQPRPSYDIRCHWIDYDRPSHDDFETHWRCPAYMPFDAELPYWIRDFCPQHRHEPAEHPMTRQQMAQVNQELGRVERTMAMPEPNGANPCAAEWAAERKRELVEQAKAAGVVG
jgi:hypothetical protein